MTVRTAVKFPIVYLVQYVLGVCLLYMLVGKWGISPKVAWLAVIAANASVSFVLSRRIILGRTSAGIENETLVGD